MPGLHTSATRAKRGPKLPVGGVETTLAPRGAWSLHVQGNRIKPGDGLSGMPELEVSAPSGSCRSSSRLFMEAWPSGYGNSVLRSSSERGRGFESHRFLQPTKEHAMSSRRGKS